MTGAELHAWLTLAGIASLVLLAVAVFCSRSDEYSDDEPEDRVTL